MRQESIVVFSALDAASSNGAKFDASQLVNMSFQGYCTTADTGGSIKIQASNDPVPSGALRSQFTPSHWVDVPNATYTITSGSAGFISLSNIAVGWIRVVFTQTTPGTGTLTVLMTGVGA